MLIVAASQIIPLQSFGLNIPAAENDYLQIEVLYLCFLALNFGFRRTDPRDDGLLGNIQMSLTAAGN